MGEKVDVLALIDRLLSGHCEERAELIEAGAAIAELIKAVHQVEAVEDEMHRAYLAGQRRDTYGTVWETKDAATQKDRERRYEAAHKRLAAALANIGGAK